MRKLLLTLLVVLLASPLYAQTTANQVTPGYLTTTGCPQSGTSCFKPAATPVNSAATEANHVLKASAGTLFGLSVTSSAAGYVLIYNAISAPPDGAVTPVACYYLSSGPGSLGIAFTPFPLNMSTGITVVFSSTGCFTQTSSSTAFFGAQVL